MRADRTSDRAVEDLLTGRSAGDDPALAAALDLLRALPTTPAPSAALAQLLREGCVPAQPPAVRAPRRTARAAAGAFVVGLTTLLASASANALPAPVQGVVADAVEAVSPFDVPRPTGIGDAPTAPPSPSPSPATSVAPVLPRQPAVLPAPLAPTPAEDDDPRDVRPRDDDDRDGRDDRDDDRDDPRPDDDADDRDEPREVETRDADRNEPREVETRDDDERDAVEREADERDDERDDAADDARDRLRSETDGGLTDGDGPDDAAEARDDDGED